MDNRLTALSASLLAAATFLLTPNANAQGGETLFRVISVSGDCQAARPTLDRSEVASARMYPLGTTLRLAAGAEMVFNYKNNNYTFYLTGPAEVLVAAGEGGALLQVVLAHGKIRAQLLQATKHGDVTIEAPGFSCVPGPECHVNLDVTRGADMVAADITLDRGEARVFGPHFNLPVLKSCALRVQSALDRSLTRITGVQGEFPVQVDNNDEAPMEFAMKPNAVVKIARRLAPVTGRESVSVLIVNELGVGHASYSFIPGDPSLFTTVTLRKPPEEVAEVDGEADAGGAAQTRAAMPGTVYDDGAEVESDYGGGAGDDGVFYFNID